MTHVAGGQALLRPLDRRVLTDTRHLPIEIRQAQKNRIVQAGQASGFQEPLAYRR